MGLKTARYRNSPHLEIKRKSLQQLGKDIYKFQNSLEKSQISTTSIALFPSVKNYRPQYEKGTSKHIIILVHGYQASR